MKQKKFFQLNRFVGAGKLMQVSLALILSALLLASCGGSSNENESQTETETETETEIETVSSTETVGKGDNGLYGEDDPF